MILLLSVLFAFSVNGFPISLAECNSCCSQHFTETLFPGAERDLSISRCGDGCLNLGPNTERLCEEEADPSCLLGQSLIVKGFADVNTGSLDGPETIFCVQGQLDISFAPSSSPTKPSRPPVAFPTDEPSNPDDETASDLIPIILAGGGAGLLLIAAIIYLLKPTETKDFAEDISQLEQHSTTNQTIQTKVTESNQSVQTKGTQTVLNIQAKERAKYANKIVKYQVISDFIAQSEDELTVHVGEIVEGITPVNDEWWFVRNINGNQGMVALAFLKEYQVIHLEEEEKPNDPNDQFPDVIRSPFSSIPKKSNNDDIPDI